MKYKREKKEKRLCEVEAKYVPFLIHIWWLPCEWRKMQRKRLDRVKDKKTNHHSLSLFHHCFLAGPPQSVFHSTYIIFFNQLISHFFFFSLSQLIIILYINKPHKPSLSSSPLPPQEAFISLSLPSSSHVYLKSKFKKREREYICTFTKLKLLVLVVHIFLYDSNLIGW